MRDAKTMQQRSGKAASKPSSSQAKKRSEPAEPAGEDAAGSAPSQETQRKKQRKEVVFGAQFMLFRVLCVAALVSGAYALPGVWTFTAGTSAEEAVKVLAKAGAVVEAVRLVWRRAGSDGRNGTDFKSHEPDSRTHRYHRERGFRLPDQDEVDQDARAAATHQRLREEPSAQISSGQKVKNWALFERYVLTYHAKFLERCEAVDSSAARLDFLAPPQHIVVCYADFLRNGGEGGTDIHRKGGTIKTYLSALTGTCFDLGVANPPHTKSKLLSDKLAEWKDTDDVLSAESMDMVTDLPACYAACWAVPFWNSAKKLQAWTMFLFAFCIMARASDLTTYCPDIADIRLPSENDWDPDGLPQYIEVCVCMLHSTCVCTPPAQHLMRHNHPCALRLTHSRLASRLVS